MLSDSDRWDWECINRLDLELSVMELVAVNRRIRELDSELEILRTKRYRRNLSPEARSTLVEQIENNRNEYMFTLEVSRLFKHAGWQKECEQQKHRRLRGY